MENSIIYAYELMYMIERGEKNTSNSKNKYFHGLAGGINMSNAS